MHTQDIIERYNRDLTRFSGARLIDEIEQINQHIGYWDCEADDDIAIMYSDKLRTEILNRMKGE